MLLYMLTMNVHLVASPVIVSTCFLFQVEVGNPNVVWSASEDGTLRQHDFREGTSCPPAGSSHQECRNVLVRLTLYNMGFPFIHFYVLDTPVRILFVEVNSSTYSVRHVDSKYFGISKTLVKSLTSFDLLSSPGYNCCCGCYMTLVSFYVDSMRH